DPSSSPNCTALSRQDTEPDLRQTPFGTFGGDDQIATVGEDATDANSIAINRGDHRLGKVREHYDRAEPAPLRQLLDEMSDGALSVGTRIFEVGSGAEGCALVVTVPHAE